MSSGFSDEVEFRVELVGDDTLVLAVIVADAEMSVRDLLDVNRPAVFECKIDARKGGVDVVFRVSDPRVIYAEH